MTKTIIFAGIIGAFAALPASANEWSNFDRNKMLNHMMIMMDMDDDGFISQSEYEAATEEMFINADIDNNGYLSRQEVSKHAARMRKEAGVPRYSEATVESNPHPRKNR
jgi:hypothetical protein